MPFPGTYPVLNAFNVSPGAIRLSWTPSIPDTGLVVFDYMIAYTRVDPAPSWPPSGGPYTPDGGWFIYAPHGDPATPRPPTTTKDIGLSAYNGVLHHFIIEASFAPTSDPTNPGYYITSPVIGGTPTASPPSPVVTDRLLYGTHGGFATTDSNLYTIDPNTVAITLVGDTGHFFTGLAFDPTDHTKLYGVTGNLGAGQQTLFSVNKDTGATTTIGSLGTTIADITFDASGQMYGLKVSTKRLCTINKLTGAVVEVGASGITLSGTGGFGLSVDPSNDNLVWLFPHGAAGDVFNMNKTTGVATNIGVLYPTVAAGSNIGAVTFGPSNKLYAVGSAIPGPLFTINLTPSVFDEYAETFVGYLPHDESWDSLAWGYPPPHTPGIDVSGMFFRASG